MIAYNKEGLDALYVLEYLQDWRSKKVLSATRADQLEAEHKSIFYQPNVFVRIGLALFTMILLQSGMGIGWLVAGSTSDESISLLLLVMGLITLVFMERIVIARMHHLGSGVDDMMLYVGVGMLLTSIFMLMPYTTDTREYALIALPFLVVGTLRYADRLMVVGAFICALTICFQTLKNYPDLALYVLPFAGMVFGLAAYWLAANGQRRFSLRYWYKVLTVIELLGLVTLYASGNYWVIQQAAAELFQLETVPLAGLFWFLTFAIPVAYIVIGLYRKDRLMLDIGLACVGAAIFTFRYYYHVLPLNLAAVIAGVVLFGSAYFSIRYLRKKEGAYTYEPESKTFWLQEVEEQLIEQTIANQPAATPDKGQSFGGGSFGGGGASGEF